MDYMDKYFEQWILLIRRFCVRTLVKKVNNANPVSSENWTKQEKSLQVRYKKR